MEGGPDGWMGDDEAAGGRPASFDGEMMFAAAMEEAGSPFGSDTWADSQSSELWAESQSESSEPVDDEGLWGGADVDFAAVTRGAPAAAAPVPSPPVKLSSVHPSAKRQRSQTADTAAALDPACPVLMTLAPETAYMWLEDAAVTGCGARPPFLRDIVDVEGRIYKEHVSTRRAQGTDLWSIKGGPKGCTVKRVGTHAWVKRAYGAQPCQQVCL
jgi:hypothetical protein